MGPSETPVWRSGAPVRALTVAVIGALREMGVGPLQAGVQLLELAPYRPVRTPRGRQVGLRGWLGALMEILMLVLVGP